jgi:exodeoxyribonuclease VII large subunit
VLSAPETIVTGRSEEMERLLRRSSAAVSSLVVRATDQLGHLQAQVRALSPQKTLDRGYAVVELANGLPARATEASGHAVVRDPSEAPSGTALSVRVAHGLFGATSTGTLQQGEPHA